jgi:hypothetical protein
MRRQPPPPLEPSTDEQDRAETSRLVLVTRPGEHTTGKRRAFIITLQSGKEILLIIPSKVAIDLAKLNGYVGRIREATDDDNVQIAELTGRQQQARQPSTEVVNDGGQ